MKKQIVCLASLCVFLSPLYARAFDDVDWQYWNTNTIVGTLVEPESDLLESVSARMQGKWRWGDDVCEYYYQQIDIGLSLNRLATDWFSLGLFYKNCWQKTFFDVGDTWFEERRPYVTGTVHVHVGRWLLSNRLQVERRFFNEKLSGIDDAWRFRDRLALTAPVQWTSMAITPYVTNEIFNEDLAGGINQNRLTAGLCINRLFMIDRLSLDVSFLWLAADAGADWVDHFIVGTNLIVSFQ